MRWQAQDKRGLSLHKRLYRARPRLFRLLWANERWQRQNRLRSEMSVLGLSLGQPLVFGQQSQTCGRYPVCTFRADSRDADPVGV
ncbi:MAG: hypothetical protein HOO93_14795 [Methyloglobulus sp.]|nr:hypothetical protein [Methyloglobulus sp.]